MSFFQELFFLALPALALIVIAVITIVNTLFFPRLRKMAGSSQPFDRISVLIPARDEAAVIRQTVSSLLAQQEAGTFEVLVLDDHSSDGTGALAREAANGDLRLHVLESEPLPDGWLGKNWACHQLSEAATGDLLVFTDADVQWGGGALAALLGEFERSRAPVVTVWPTQRTVTWGERLVVPLMALVIQGMLPSPLANYTRTPGFTGANGQCLAFTRAAYQAVGGHQAVRGSVVEDLDLAKRAKASRLRVWMADGNQFIGCRMYRRWGEVRNGFAKNIIAGYGSIPALLFAAVFYYLVFFTPWLIFLIALLNGQQYIAITALALGLIGITVRALTAVATHQRPLDALFMPISVLLMTVISAQAIYWQLRFGGPRWKGRTITRG